MPDANPNRTHSVWQTLATAFRVSISPNSLFLATCGLLLTTGLWQLVGGMFGVTDQSTTKLGTIDSTVIERATQFLGINPEQVPVDPIMGVPCAIAAPFVRLFATGQSWTHVSYNVLGGLGTLVVWSFFGLAISRMSMLQCGTDERLPLGDAARFAARKWTAVIGAPVASLLAIVAIGLPVYAISWLIRFDIGVLLMAAAWLFIVAIALLMCVLAIGLVFAWPLMWSAIAAEDSDLFDAISRSYAYTYQRPIHYLFYASMAAALGLFGWLMAWFVSEVVIDLAFWTVQVGGGAERTELLRSLAESTPLTESTADAESGMFSNGGRLIGAINSILRTIAGAFSYSFFWSAAAGIYLMLRYDTDETLFDDIVVNDSGPDTGLEDDTAAQEHPPATASENSSGTSASS